MRDLTMMQRLLRKPVNWIVERFYPNGAFYGHGFISMLQSHDTAKDGKISAGVAGYLIQEVIDQGGTKSEKAVTGLNLSGIPVGDWRVTVEQIKEPRQ